jgi:glycerophosphoryl diester phosphodiesterase
LRLAIEHGADGVEVDVQRTSDGVPVLVHDSDWRRTTGHAAAVRELPWERVCQLDAGSWFSPDCSGVRPGTLDDALEVAGTALVNLEIKSPHLDAALSTTVAARVRERGLQERVLLTSFDHESIDALAEAHDDLELGYLTHRAIEVPPHRVQTLVLLFQVVLADTGIVRSAHEVGRGVFVYTVDDVETAERLRRAGVDGIITNQPQRLRQAWD